MASTYISVTDTAKMLRAALKRHWPAVKFSVRSSSYAGGASIRVGWHNGPSGAMVDRVAQRFAGGDFDGMTDSMSYHRDILVADNGTMREVHFGADFVFCTRETADGLIPACEAEYRKGCVINGRQDEISMGHWIWDALSKLSIPEAESVEETARRVVAQVFNPVQS